MKKTHLDLIYEISGKTKTRRSLPSGGGPWVQMHVRSPAMET
jgi:hypothetical protein